MTPVAPLRLSGTTGCPSACESGTATARPTTSGELPGGKLITSLTGFAGHTCAFALSGAAMAANNATTIQRWENVSTFMEGLGCCLECSWRARPSRLLERQPGVLLGQCDLRVVRQAEILQLVLLRALVEVARAGKAMQQVGQIPRDAHRAPDAAQLAIAVTIQQRA